MSNWTRAKDAHIARECEGLEVSDAYGSEPHEIRFDGPWRPVASYFTDPAAAIRAAEAWRKMDEEIDRTVTLHSAVDRMDLPFRAYLHENYLVDGRYEWRAVKGESESDYWPALAQALYRATSGPED